MVEEGSTVENLKTVKAVWCIGVTLVGVVLVLNRPLLARVWTHWCATHRGEGANLQGANFVGADLARANLKKANLRGACLVRAQCFDANLRGADLRDANLRDALLAGADLRWAQLSGARLQGAVYDKSTRWPQGFNPKKHGAMQTNWDARLWQAFGRSQP
jgi:hypothetical protein